MKRTKLSFRHTSYACYTGNFIQAVVVNITPVLFIPLREQFGLTFEQLGFLVLVNFITQVFTDISFSFIIDRFGFRHFISGAHLLAAAGLIIFALSPIIFSNPYHGFIFGTIIFSAAGGLLELLLSPIINGIPSKEKASAMSVLHSFFCWGQLTVVLVTSLFLFLKGG